MAAIDITATKPASQPGNPSWATNGGTRVAPTLGQKQSGWTNAQRPPFNVFNWILGFLADWAKYFEDATDELDGAKLSRKGAGASTPQGMIGTLSSERDATDDCGATGTRWATVWTYIVEVTQYLGLTNTAATKNTAIKNRLLTRNLIKAAGIIHCAAGVYTLDDGMNILSVTEVTNVKKCVRVTFAAGGEMADDNYQVVFGCEGTTDQVSNFQVVGVHRATKTTAHFDIAIADFTLGGQKDIDFYASIYISFHVTGVQ